MILCISEWESGENVHSAQVHSAPSQDQSRRTGERTALTIQNLYGCFFFRSFHLSYWTWRIYVQTAHHRISLALSMRVGAPIRNLCLANARLSAMRFLHIDREYFRDAFKCKFSFIRCRFDEVACSTCCGALGSRLYGFSYQIMCHFSLITRSTHSFFFFVSFFPFSRVGLQLAVQHESLHCSSALRSLLCRTCEYLSHWFIGNLHRAQRHR